jgi:hypothetical protein
MYAIAAIGLLTMLLSVVMIASPDAWSRGIVRFADKPYFHAAEILIRLVLGGVLIAFASQTRHPTLILLLGVVFVTVGIGLVILGAGKHRAFAHRSATFRRVFRPAGFASLAFGGFIVYTALA